MNLQFVGVDSWDRPVYEDQDGKLWKDTYPSEDVHPILYSACNNEFDGEPDCPFHGEYELIPFRMVWAKGGSRWKKVKEEKKDAERSV